MEDFTAEQFAQRAFELGLLSARQLDAVWGDLGTRSAPLEDLVSALLQRELMTNYQIDRVGRGERSGYYYGDYKVLYLVGAGTFARVYRAVHKETGRVVAIKVLRKRYREDPVQTEQFLREGEMGRQLRHVNIVPVYEVHRDRNGPYLVMEFVEGRNLREFVKIRGRLPVDIAMPLIEDICAGLDYASQKGVTHRDLKMSNVLVTSDGRAKLVDFGLAAAVGASYENMEDCPNARTIDYAGLERASGARRDDVRSDVYFTGCILYNMLTGVPPLYETKERSQRLAISRFTNVKPITDLVPELPRPLVLVVQKAMELKPDRRYSKPGEMLRDLKVAEKKIKEGDDSFTPVSDAANEPIAMEGEDRTLLVVESNVDMQNFLREKLKKRGYRVLVIGDPARAIDRFREDEHTAHGVIFSTGELGLAAVAAFKRFGSEDHTRHTPAVLLYAPNQEHVTGQIEQDALHVAAPTSLKVRQLRELLLRMLNHAAAQKKGAAT